MLAIIHALLRSNEVRTHTNHVDFEPIYRNIEKAIIFQGGTKPLFHVIASQFKAAEAWVLEINKS